MAVTLMLLVSTVATGEIYTYTDEDGVVHFTDSPREGAETVDPGSPTVIDSRIPDIPARQRAEDDREARDGESDYSSLEITAPGMEETLRSTPGEVGVAVNLRPGLMRDDNLQLLLDGSPVSASVGSDGRIQLRDVPRGEHTLLARVVDASGDTMIESEPVVFYLHRISVNSPARGN